MLPRGLQKAMSACGVLAAGEQASGFLAAYAVGVSDILRHVMVGEERVTFQQAEWPAAWLIRYAGNARGTEGMAFKGLSANTANPAAATAGAQLEDTTLSLTIGENEQCRFSMASLKPNDIFLEQVSINMREGRGARRPALAAADEAEGACTPAKDPFFVNVVFGVPHTYTFEPFNIKDYPVIGHRGCGMGDFSRALGVEENTIASFAQAHARGANMVELDVFLTYDNQLVVRHDDVVGDAAGAASSAWRRAHSIPELEMARYKRLLAGLPRPEQPLLLADVLAALPSDLAVNIELKSPYAEEAVNAGNRYASRHSGAYLRRLVQRLLVELAAAPSRRYLLSSFDPEACLYARMMAPSAQICLLLSSEWARGAQQKALWDFVRAFVGAMRLTGVITSTDFYEANRGEMRALMETCAVLCYGAGTNKREAVARLWKDGVTGLITDDLSSEGAGAHVSVASAARDC